eukprot:1515947-Prymnesium_polylepis.1
MKSLRRKEKPGKADCDRPPVKSLEKPRSPTAIPKHHKPRQESRYPFPPSVGGGGWWSVWGTSPDMWQ